MKRNEENLEGVKMVEVKKSLRERFLDWTDVHPKAARNLKIARDAVGIFALTGLAFLAGGAMATKKGQKASGEENYDFTNDNVDEVVTTEF